MSDIGRDLAAFLIAGPVGRRAWIRGQGQSMWPLLNPGDGLEVERCSKAQLAKGDIALLRSEAGALTAHLVVAVEPLRTASFLGVVDPPLEVIGRAVRLERRGFRVPMSSPTRLAVLGLSRAAQWLRRVKQRRSFP